jgi:hypothetical protein
MSKSSSASNGRCRAARARVRQGTSTASVPSRYGASPGARRGRGDEDAHVRASFRDGLLDVGARLVLEADADAGMGAREGGQSAAGTRRSRRRSRRREGALDAARELDDLALQRMQRGVERADVAHERAAGLGGVDAAGAALEQRDAEPRLEIGQPLAGRGEREVLAFGAARDAARLGDGEDED